MTPEEYKQRSKILEEEASRQKALLGKEYAFSNNPYKIGDTIHDHISTTKIEKIGWTWNYLGLPYCVYYGLALKKDGLSMKKMEQTCIHQCNIK